jgi:beta-mannanase
MSRIIITFLIFQFNIGLSQIKYIIEDFEGIINEKICWEKNGLYTFGETSAEIKKHSENKNKVRLRNNFIKIRSDKKKSFGGFGKSINHYFSNLEDNDFLNFYYRKKSDEKNDTIQIEIQVNNNKIEKPKKYQVYIHLKNETEWNLTSIPLKLFKTEKHKKNNTEETLQLKGYFNQIIIKTNKPNTELDIDFLCFSNNELKNDFNIENNNERGVCLGIWTGKINKDNFTEAVNEFENGFQEFGNKKHLGIVHLFIPFFNEKDNKTENYFAIEKINEIIHKDYLPMLTLESKFDNNSIDQPNLSKIIEGKYDRIIEGLAIKLKSADGMILLRILHEFNGDWYPWSISKNKKDPQELREAFIHIVSIFKKQNVENVKFIWCPNSTSIPQEKWNLIAEAYPGDEYVDFTAMDIYNGAGQSETWQSFIKEGIATYYLLNKNFNDKPILICETASREKLKNEKGNGQTKSEWIEQMAQVLQFEMKNVKLLCWFNETDPFKIESSKASKESFYKNIIENPYFKEGVECIYDLMR